MDAQSHKQSQMSTQTQTQEGSNSDPQAWALQEL